jgi:SNF2 family DNA or RNA helicase
VLWPGCSRSFLSRKQWALELAEKFNLPAIVLDAKEHREAQASGIPNPFESESVVITSLHFASQRAGDIRTVGWDLVVIDEAHKLRNEVVIGSISVLDRKEKQGRKGAA